MSDITIGEPRSLPHASSIGSAWLHAAAWVALPCLLLVPLALVSVPGLVDYPNHLARCWILAHAAEIPALAANWVVHWRILPDLAIDVVVTALSHVMPVELAGRLFVAAAMLSLVAGTAVLHRTLYGRVGLWPLASLLFVYNAALFWGFLNCLFGIGMALLAFSGWIASRGWRPAPRLLLFAVVACALLLLHLFAFGLYGLAVGSYELGRRLDQRARPIAALLSLCRDGLQFVPGLALWVFSLRHAGTTFTSYGDFQAKLYALISPVTFGIRPEPLDLVFIASIGLALALALKQSWIRIAPEMRIPLLAMVLAAVAMPNWMSGSWAADIRLPVALPFMVIAASKVTPPRQRVGVGLASVALLLLAVRISAVGESWLGFDREVRAFRQADIAIAPGARLLIAESAGTPAGVTQPTLGAAAIANRFVRYFHLPAFAVIDRAAFVPYMFTGWTTLDVAPANTRLAQSHAGGPVGSGDLALAATHSLNSDRYWSHWPQDFDYLLWIDPGRTFSPAVPHLKQLAEGEFFRLYAIQRP